MSLIDALILYRDSGIYPFHMPGHKRNSFLLDFPADFGIDITEIDGFDNLHDANGILAGGMKKAAHLYGSDRSFYLVNGSTCGILAGIFACTKKGDKVLVARNCHKSVYNAIQLNKLDAVYLLPPIDSEFGISGSITPEQVKKALLEHPEIKLVILTSPTYEGVVSDIQGICKVAHEYGIPVLVDEAHGAHLGFHEYFPQNSVQAGADIVIHSLHKTLPSPTQTALLQVNSNLIDANDVQRQLSVFETSSPSYLLMAGIDSCIGLLSKQSKKLFDDYTEKLIKFNDRMSILKNIKIFRMNNVTPHPAIFAFDPGKIVLSVKNTNITGMELKNILLDKYLLQLEMAMDDYALAMTGIADTDEGFLRLGDALLEIDSTLENRPSQYNSSYNSELPEKVMSVYEAEKCTGYFLPFSDSIGAVSREYVYAYPPGTPLLVPGERITENILFSFKELTEKGVALKSTYGKMPLEINVAQ